MRRWRISRSEAEGAEVALFFFAGHGVQIEGANYLLGSGLLLA